MITPRDIVLHLADYLPLVTNLFSDIITVSSSSISGGYTITVNTASAHGLIIGSTILFNSGDVPNTISSIVEEVEDETALITFNNEHDFTTPSPAIVTEPLPTIGFNEAEWNTTLDIIAVPTDLEVIVNFPPTATGIPTFTPGEAIGYERRSLSLFGIQTVATVPTTTQFTVVLDSAEIPSIPDGDILNLEVARRVRVAAADSISRANEIYTKQPDDNSLWAFVIMTDTNVSKDRHTFNDGTATYSQQDEMRLRILQTFSIIVYFRSADKISGATAQEIAYGEVYENLLGVLFGFSGFAKDNEGSEFVPVTTGTGSVQVGKNGASAYYAHEYTWELPVDITVENGFTFYQDTAFRRIESSFGMFTSDNEEKLTLAFDLDP